MRGSRDDRRVEVLDKRALERVDRQALVNKTHGHAHRGQLHGRQRATAGSRRFLDDLHLNGTRTASLIEARHHQIAQLACTTLQMSLRKREHVEHRHLAMGHIRPIHVNAQRSLERRQCELTRTQGTHKRMRPAGLDQIAAAHDNARLCGTEQFIARARHQIEPCRNRRRRGFFAAAHQDVVRQQCPRALVFIEQQAVLMGQCGEFP